MKKEEREKEESEGERKREKETKKEMGPRHGRDQEMRQRHGETKI